MPSLIPFRLPTSLKPVVATVLAELNDGSTIHAQRLIRRGKYGNISSRSIWLSNATMTVKIMQRYSFRDGRVTSESITYPRH